MPSAAAQNLLFLGGIGKKKTKTKKSHQTKQTTNNKILLKKKGTTFFPIQFCTQFFLHSTSSNKLDKRLSNTESEASLVMVTDSKEARKSRSICLLVEGFLFVLSSSELNMQF